MQKEVLKRGPERVALPVEEPVRHLVMIACEYGTWKVDPPRVKAKVGEEIVWKVEGSSAAVLLVPEGKLFGKRDYDIGADGTLRLQVKEGLGKHPYAIHCQRDNCFAEGGSNPVVIVDP